MISTSCLSRRQVTRSEHDCADSDGQPGETSPHRSAPLLQKPPRQPYQSGHQTPSQEEFLGDSAVDHTGNDRNAEPFLQLRHRRRGESESGEHYAAAEHAANQAGTKLRLECGANGTASHDSLKSRCAEANRWRKPEASPYGECENEPALRKTCE